MVNSSFPALVFWACRIECDLTTCSSPKPRLFAEPVSKGSHPIRDTDTVRHVCPSREARSRAQAAPDIQGTHGPRMEAGQSREANRQGFRAVMQGPWWYGGYLVSPTRWEMGVLRLQTLEGELLPRGKTLGGHHWGPPWQDRCGHHQVTPRQWWTPPGISRHPEISLQLGFLHLRG